MPRLSNRTFGVEIECSFPGGPRDARHLFERTAGFEHWANEYIHSDGSDTEIPSPVLSGVEGLKELRAAMELLVENGAYVTSADGMHVHHGGEEFISDEALTWKLVESWVANQELIGQMVVPFRRHGYWACPITWNETQIARFKDKDQPAMYDPWYGTTTPEGKLHPKDTRVGGRGALNVSALNSHGTIEIRQHEGCLDPDVAEAWVRFGQGFIETVARSERPLSCAASVGDLLTTVGVTAKSREVALAKVHNQPEMMPEPGDDYYDDDYEDDEPCGCGCED